MKKVKMLTFHNAENYGAMLQAYALKETLKRLNTNPSFVNYINKDILKDYALFKTKSIKSFWSSLWYLPRNLKRKTSFKKFKNKFLDGNSKQYYTKKQIEQDIQNDDIYMAGSDQIFNPVLTNGVSDIYTLNFGENITKIIYGASIGNDELLNKYSKDFNEKLQSVDLLSIREEGLVSQLSQITGKNAEKVLDPTLLLTKKDWEELIQNNNSTKPQNEKYILVYTLFENDEITKIVNWLSKETGLKVIHFRKYNIYKNELMSLYTKGPVEFINAFRNAEYIITNSFHGLVFSIIFERKFYAILPKERAGRLKDLLTTLKLDSRSVCCFKDILDKNIKENINYVKIKEKIEKLKEESLEFIKKGINI